MNVVLEPTRDAERVMGEIVGGGIAIVPLDVAYAVLAGTGAAIRTIFEAKGRSFEKPNGMMASFELFTEVHLVDRRERDIVRSVTHDFGLPLSVVAPFRGDHPIFADADPFTMERSTKLGTLDLLLNAGPLHSEISRLSHERLQPVFGSSANASLTGSKFRLADIESRVREVATVEIDYGLARYANSQGISSTIIDLKTFEVHRHGVCFDQIADILARYFSIELTPNQKDAA